ncbi:type II secretion system protein GspG [Aporhodopirellula aestuarii]|uniref:Type II secretion system protein GspG n=1 Tax=Aporhodopirellula aestuarii TaxID=2950107 RepID=A0ABT0U3Z1_9BACT|nr:type II secretion system protein GspG [Aporhodopirellula aestuarii]MCM2371639.1 type II secretion system protein GspG [Aporhodopirellula aestuarii]
MSRRQTINLSARRRLSGSPGASRRSVRRSGFTLLELLLVLAILVVIGGIVGTNILGAKSDADINATQAQLNSLKSNVVYYKLKTNSLPEALEQLRDGPSDAAKKAQWVDSIIESVPVDAWGNEFDFSTKGNQFEIRSAGLDGQMNTEDDIVVEGR